jgi:hypothetical protein
MPIELLGLLPGTDAALGVQTYWGVAAVAATVAQAVRSDASGHTPPSEVREEIVTALVQASDGSPVGFIHNPNFKLP